jgi:hypothetical protein
MSIRKRWQTRQRAMPYTHSSRAAAYRFVAIQRTHWRDGLLQSPMISVLVDERDGRGWKIYERIDLRADGSIRAPFSVGGTE